MAENREISQSEMQEARRRHRELFNREQQQTGLVQEFLAAQGIETEDVVRDRMLTRGILPGEIDKAVHTARSYRNSEELEGLHEGVDLGGTFGQLRLIFNIRVFSSRRAIRIFTRR